MKKYLTKNEVAADMGWTPQRLMKLVGRGLGPRCLRPSPKTALFPVEEVERWRASWETPPRNERKVGDPLLEQDYTVSAKRGG